MGRKSCGCRGKCHCHQPKQIVYPVREEVKNRYSEETVQHIHPSHTTIVNNHTIRNEHSYPHTTSYENRVNEVDVRGAFEGPGGEVRGVFDRPYGNVRGATSPYRGGCNDRVGGRMDCRCHGKCGCSKRRRGWW